MVFSASDNKLVSCFHDPLCKSLLGGRVLVLLDPSGNSP